jgi:hypothetical protein
MQSTNNDAKWYALGRRHGENNQTPRPPDAGDYDTLAESYSAGYDDGFMQAHNLDWPKGSAYTNETVFKPGDMVRVPSTVGYWLAEVIEQNGYTLRFVLSGDDTERLENASRVVFVESEEES